MRKFLLCAAAAGLAITAPVAATSLQPEGKGKPEKADRGNRGGGNGNAKAQRGPDRQEMRGNQGRGNDKVQARGNRGNGNGNDRVRVVEDRGPAMRGNRGNGNDNVRVRDNGNGNAARNVNDRVVVRDTRRGTLGDLDWRYGDAGRLNDGCPPGLAKKNNGCLPPGQAKQIYGKRLPGEYADRRLTGVLADWFGRDDRYDYRYGDDYIYRIGSGGLVDALIPLYDRRGYYYPVGTRYPSAYDSYNLPYQYRSYYDEPYYRYGDGAIYRIDPQTRLIQSVVSLLTGDLGVGQRLPNSYSVYNVPTSYRQTYYDTPQNMYRYSDGNIYRVDPTTMLIAEVIKAVI